MAADRRPNKKAATEDELGHIHKLVTTLHSSRLEHMLNLIKQGADVEDVIGDGKALQAAGKWASDQNSITCAAPEMSEETELSKRLKAIKQAQGGKGARAVGDNVLPFTDEEDYT